MIDLLIDWLSENYIELSGALLGLVYIILSVRQNIYTWPAGILSSALYVFVFFEAKLYAFMFLQVYYVAVSIYGWHYWLRGRKGEDIDHRKAGRINKKETVIVLVSAPIIFITIYLILKNFTDSNVPVADAFTTTMGIVATWMLARKILENWLLWIVSDTVSIGLYVIKGLWPTVVLYLVYWGMALVGYGQWKKSMSAEGK